VVATRAGGVPDLVGDAGPADDLEAGGTVLETGDVEGCVKAAVTLLTDSEMRATTGAAARERVQRRFSVERMVREYEGLYRSLLNGAR